MSGLFATVNTFRARLTEVADILKSPDLGRSALIFTESLCVVMSLGNTTADGNQTKTQSPKTKTRNPKNRNRKPKQNHKPKTRHSSSLISFGLMPQSFKNFPRFNNFKFYIFWLIQNTVSCAVPSAQQWDDCVTRDGMICQMHFT